MAWWPCPNFAYNHSRGRSIEKPHCSRNDEEQQSFCLITGGSNSFCPQDDLLSCPNVAAPVFCSFLVSMLVAAVPFAKSCCHLLEAFGESLICRHIKTTPVVILLFAVHGPGDSSVGSFAAGARQFSGFCLAL